MRGNCPRTDGKRTVRAGETDRASGRNRKTDERITEKRVKKKGRKVRRNVYIYAMTVAAVVCSLSGCGQKSRQTQGAESVRSIAFSADSAYEYASRQVAFGARVPGSDAHAACRDWLMGELERHGVRAEEQQGVMVNYAGEAQTVRNIVGHVEGQGVSRATVLLCAHWDSRPWCDEEEEYADRFVPVPGANDGASGVGVLMEVVRGLQALRGTEVSYPPVDVVFFDCEDMGTPNHYTGVERENTWCLGSQLWAQRYMETPENKRVRYEYGILLDMVGDPSATFPKEYFSVHYAQPYVERVWRAAASLGYGRYFTNQAAYPVTDDHYYVNVIAGIPCIDVIDYKMGSETGFPDWWHTKRDDMRNINKQTLKAVGETVMTSICSK